MKKLAPSSLKLPSKRLRFWENSRLLTTYGCREPTFVSGVGPGVRTVTRASMQNSVNLLADLMPSTRWKLPRNVVRPNTGGVVHKTRLALPCFAIFFKVVSEIASSRPLLNLQLVELGNCVNAHASRGSWLPGSKIPICVSVQREAKATLS